MKAGSFVAPIFGSFSPYDEEILLAYDAGANLTLLDGRVKLNMAAFYYDYEHYQSYTFVNQNSILTNEDATYKGFEVEFVSVPTDRLELMLGISYTDAVAEDLQVATDVSVDTAPPFTPEWQASGLVRYTWDAFGGTLATQISANYQSEFYHNARNFSAHEFDGYTDFKVRVAWTDAEGKWDVSAYIDNLTDEDYAKIGFDVSGFYGTTQVSYAKPRSYGLKIRRSF